ncbi:phytoene desaturase [Aestuariivirga litoralis]|uniref:Phytoene desaturase (neurosporene-forming) n=1 Tax=Aestuariivirga litoralis TaxID=2650924 RepID=A0A2W2BRK7_9HYPH|nr:phytoene desaturase [Aestuariivirga litoralis]PZF76046.1 phytoene desaturase [Aestuariivirga litoralis]
MFTDIDHPPPRAAVADRRPHAAVIGSGLGGLAAAIRLGARGYRVTVYEKLEQPGGRASVFRQDGFTFDAGPTIITAPFILDELWSLAGETFSDDVTLKALDPFYDIRFDDGTVMSCCADPARMAEEIRRISPSDVAGYERFMTESEAIYRIGFEQLGHVPFGSPLDMLKIAPDLLRLGAWRTVHQHVAARVKDPKIRMALSFHPLFIGGNPFKVTAIYSMIAYLERAFGVHFAMGGTGALVQAMARLVQRQGNRIVLNTAVDEITCEGSRVTGLRLADGTEVPAAIVVSNAETAHTYTKLLRNAPRRRWSDAKLAKARYSMSLFVWYFGTNRKYEDVKHHTIMMGPRYRELLQDIFERKILAKDFSLYLHRPTATDPSLAPEGCDSFYVLSPVPHQDSGIDWATQAQTYKAAIAEHLDHTLLPGFRDHIVTEKLMTPIDFATRLSSAKGAAFGLEPVLLQSAWFRPNNKAEDIENLFLVGAGTHPGAGVPGVVSSARILDTVVPDAAAFA